jgi:hypothetical protein
LCIAATIPAGTPIPVLDCSRQARQQGVENGLRGGTRKAPVAVQQVAHIVEVLNRQRLVEVQLLTQRVQRILAERQAGRNVSRERIDTRHASQQKEDDDADTQQHQPERGQPLQHIGQESQAAIPRPFVFSGLRQRRKVETLVGRIVVEAADRRP